MRGQESIPGLCLERLGLSPRMAKALVFLILSTLKYEQLIVKKGEETVLIPSVIT